ncbi:FAD-dependent oxidoreductase [Desulfoferrobacter suflitae]|uniref:FAD-dependent oxidoreductase n=1 Tax=Desulfoferrobacter suflitae TaxID=2865782 RepID=UPI00216468BB|nr:FAD-dependent oxidoreductase [Desulfoferrobacter suflitae]MCK8604269.1 FAD-dependent oxidoreductase [Desulfoferrobacter suflitae]
MPNLLIIGGSDAGISAALRARELDPTIEITVAVADRYPNFSICGLPFYLSGEVSNWRTLAHRSIKEIERAGIHLLLDHSATSIDVERKEVRSTSREDGVHRLAYDRLIIGTGAEPIRPQIDGIDQQGVFLLRWMDDAFALHEFMAAKQPQSAVVVGGGYIGMEMADALTYRGLKVTVVEYAASVLSNFDREFGERTRRELESHGVTVATGVAVGEIERRGHRLVVLGSNDFSVEADLVLVAVGARPRSELARSAGIETGINGAIKVDRFMRTNTNDIFAAGDCVETWHRVMDRYAYLPLGTTAHKQGRIAGENAAGGRRKFQGSLGTQAVKIFDLVFARTGLRDSEAATAGFHPLTVECGVLDHKAYYPGAKKLHIRITGDCRSHRLLGAQIVGHKQSEVSKRIDIFASALYNGMRVEDLNDLDLSYTPPLSSPWDPIQTSAQTWSQAVRKPHKS